jgi:ATP-dependent DNA helicase RecG
MPVKSPQALLTHLCEYPESEWLEFKVDNQDPEQVGQILCAIANAAILHDKDAGYLVFGVEDQTRRKVGASRPFRAQKKGGEDIENWLSRLMEPKLQIEVSDFKINDLNFSILRIEPTYERPISFAGNEYLRIGPNVKKLKEFPSHERSIWLSTSKRKFEHSVALPNISSDSIDELLDTENYFRLRKIPKPTDAVELARKLCSDSILAEDMEGGFHVTNLGAILIARDISAFPSVAKKSVRIVSYRGINKRDAESEIEGTKGYAIGFEAMLKYIMKRIPGDEKYIDGIRTLVPRIPEIAVRELVANALIHQDFTISGNSPFIEMFADRIEITNPGNSIIPIDRIIDEKRSRNELLAKTLRDLGICEERGGGLDKSLIAIEENHLPAFEFHSTENSMRAILFGPKPFSSLSKSERMRACYFHCVLKWINRDFMGNTSLRQRFSLLQEDYQVVSSIITESVRAERIKPAETSQGKRNAKYIPIWA